MKYKCCDDVEKNCGTPVIVRANAREHYMRRDKNNARTHTHTKAGKANPFVR